MHAIVTTVWRNKYKSVCVCVCVGGGGGGGGGKKERESIQEFGAVANLTACDCLVV